MIQLLHEKKRKKRYYLCYTLLFLALTAIMFSFFVRNQKTYLWITDGWRQHYQALLYYARYLRSLLENLFRHGQWSLPGYSFSLGQGADVLGTLHYYAIGDPINLLSAIVPSSLMPAFYALAVHLRLYLAGITFSLFCFDHQQRKGSRESGSLAILLGALMYAFCGYALFASVRHPFFINPMIYFPLVLLGIEKMLHQGKPYVLVLGVFLSAVSNFYFFYMIVLLTILYVIWRFLSDPALRNRRGLCSLAQIIAFSALGAGLGMVTLLPMILSFLGDARSATSASYALFYDFSDIWQRIGHFLQAEPADHWSCFGYAAVVLVCLCLLLVEAKAYKRWLAAFLVLSVMLLLPAAGSVMNGFSYATNRWVWGFGFFLCLLFVELWDRLFQVSLRKAFFVSAGCLLYALLCLMDEENRILQVLIPVGIALITCAILLLHAYRRSGTQLCKGLIAIGVVVNIALNGCFLYAPGYGQYVDQFIGYGQTDPTDSEITALQVLREDLGDESFYRYTGISTLNAALNEGENNLQFFWSLANRHITDFQQQMALPYGITFQYSGVDERSALTTLANVRYYIGDGSLMDGFEKRPALTIDNPYSDQIWENQYTLPFGYTYEKAISQEQWLALTPLQREEALLQAVVLTEANPAALEETVSVSSRAIPFDVETSEGAERREDGFVVTEAGAQVTLRFSGLPRAETYLYWTGLDYQGLSPCARYSEEEWGTLSAEEQQTLLAAERAWTEPERAEIQLISQGKDGRSWAKSITHFTPAYQYYSGQEDYLIHLGYTADGMTAVTLTFPEAGLYPASQFQVLCQPMDAYPDRVSALASDVLTEVDFHDEQVFHATNRITGEITLDTAKYLLLTIPYSDGWSATVDGEEAKLMQANTMYMALALQPGQHQIELRYQTPGLVAGTCLSLLSLVILCLYAVFQRRKAHQQ